MNPDKAALFRSVKEDPADFAPWGVYADWLDENGEPEAARDARRQQVHIGERERLAATWLARGSPRIFGHPDQLFGRHILNLAAGQIGGLAHGLSFGDWCRLWNVVWRYRRAIRRGNPRAGIELVEFAKQCRREIPGMRDALPDARARYLPSDIDLSLVTEDRP